MAEADSTRCAASQRFDVFLSHNSRDKPSVERIAQRLRSMGLAPWLDIWCLTPGGNWQEELGVGLRASSACAVFVGPHGLGDWVREELHVALDRGAKDRSFRVFLVLLPGIEEPFDAAQLPPFLATRTWVDLRKGFENSLGLQRLVNAIKGIAPGPGEAADRQNGVCPYRGLRPFDEDDAEFFFGRERDVQRLVERLKGARFLAVLGPSGSGKSSLVRAGLIPAIRADALQGSNAWTIRLLTPGAHPLTTLAALVVRLSAGQAMQSTLDQLRTDERSLHLAVSLARVDRPLGERIVWVIDQFEELFTLCHDDSERRAFLANLLYAAAIPGGRDVVVLTMRADFYPRCAAHADLAGLMGGNQFLVSAMDVEGLRQAIEQPAWRVGLEFEQGLTETILDDVARQPGALPLLEHALLELWERRRGHMLTLEAYRESGGVQGAIAQRAEAIFTGFSADEQAVARRILLRLTQPGEGTEDTRRRAPMSEFVARGADATMVDRVVQALVDARLLTVSAEASNG
jgi:hypothetical protein